MIINGTTYHDQTPGAVWKVLEDVRTIGCRVKIYYGEPGKLWGDAEVGRVSRSMGPNKIPIICHNRRSTGGAGILDHCIMGIRYANKHHYRNPWLYRHPSLMQELTDLKTSHRACGVKEDRCPTTQPNPNAAT